MKKYKWNKEKFAVNMMKLEGIIFASGLCAGMFILAFIKTGLYVV